MFPAQIACNVIPFIGAEQPNGYTDEEMKMQNEGRRILRSPELRVNCTCVRVPVLRSHSIALTLRTERKITPREAADRDRSVSRLPRRARYLRPQLSDASGRQRTGHGVGRAHPRGSD